MTIIYMPGILRLPAKKYAHVWSNDEFVHAEHTSFCAQLPELENTIAVESTGACTHGGGASKLAVEGH